MINKDFLRDILAGRKRLLKLSEVKWIAVPRYDEVNVLTMMAKFKDDAEVQMLIPDKLPKGRLPDREYFFNCLNTIHPAYMHKLVQHANAQRFDSSQKQEDAAVVQVSEDWWDKLNEVPFVSVSRLITLILVVT